MTTLVIGGTGLLGSAVVASVDDAVPASRRTGYDFFTDDPRTLLDAHEPDAVVFAAFVERTDHDRSTFVRAAREFVDACRDCRLVYVSSDAVFDGCAGRYGPGDEPSPRDEYGRRLVAFEDAVETHPDSAVLRPSYVYAGDPLSPRLAAARDALAEGRYERFDDVYRSPAPVADVAAGVRALLRRSAAGVYHVPGPRLSVYEFVRRALDAAGADTSSLVAAAAPPAFDVARDRSLVDPRYESELGVEVRPPEDAL
jgi:dTDP-4-dehydrorhamnose reductase